MLKIILMFNRFSLLSLLFILTLIHRSTNSSIIIPFGHDIEIDGTASEILQAGEIYQWKVYADDDRADGVQTLISASEDLLGIFEIP